MGTYNSLEAEVTCPRCRGVSAGKIDLYFGKLDFSTYHLGNLYQWIAGKEPQNGGKPREQPASGLGYTECAHCSRDCFMRVQIAQDKLMACKPLLERAPYQPDFSTEFEFKSPFVSSPTLGTILLFENFSVAAFVTESPRNEAFQVNLSEPYQLRTPLEKLVFQPPLYRPQFDLMENR